MFSRQQAITSTKMSTLSFVGVHSLNDVSIFSQDIRNISFMLNNDPSDIETNKTKSTQPSYENNPSTVLKVCG